MSSLAETIPIPPPTEAIARTLEEAGFETWFVGGGVRDFLLGEDPSPQWDLATAARPDDVQRAFKKTVPIGIEHGTVGVIKNGILHEVTTFRRDVQTDGRHAVVEFGATLEEDLARRDFTVNAIAYHPFRHEWRDPHGGREDLDRKMLRAVGDPTARFREDYLRILRGVRFAARFAFKIDTRTWEAARAAAPGLAQLSAERVFGEWTKALETTKSLLRLTSLWMRVGAANAWFPELIELDDEPPLLPPVGQRDAVVLTVLVALDPVAVLRRLKASKEAVSRAAALAAGPQEPGGITPLATRRWLAAVGESWADFRTLWELREGKSWPWASLVAQIQRRGDPLTRGDLAVTGDDLLAAGLEPGPGIGATLEELLRRVIDEPRLNTRDGLLGLVGGRGSGGSGGQRRQ